MRKVVLLSTYFLITPILLLASIVFFSFLTYVKNPSPTLGYLFNPPKTVSYAALPTADTELEEQVTQTDARVELVRQFFAKYKSPLEPYAEDVVRVADKYGMDFRLIPAIGMQESNLCKRSPENSHNCWGFGIYGKKVTRFESYPDAIEAVTKTLSNKYINQGLVTPEEIMTKYTPSSNGSWAAGVNHFMDQLQ